MSRPIPGLEVPFHPYDPEARNPGVEEIRRQREAGEPMDAYRALELLQAHQGYVKFGDWWVKDVPYSQANWEGDGA